MQHTLGEEEPVKPADNEREKAKDTSHFSLRLSGANIKHQA